MKEGNRKPFVFGVGYILDESELDAMLHQQFNSDEELVEYMKARGFEIDFRKPNITIDANTGVVVQSVGVSKGGGVGCLDLIDEKDRSKLQKLIDEAAEIQRRRKLGDRSVMGLFG